MSARSALAAVLSLDSIAFAGTLGAFYKGISLPGDDYT
jgi:hypothetical protein